MSVKKRLIFCTYSSVYSSLVLEELLKSNDIEVVAIINSTRVFKPEYGHLRGAIRQIRTTGLRYATYLFLITDVFSWFRLFIPSDKKPLEIVRQMALNSDIPLYETRDINNKSSITFISKHSPDYLLAAHFNQLIKPALLALPKLGCLNIHPSLLPAYKGVDPVFYAMLNKEQSLGVTLHKMSEVFDQGEVISQKTLQSTYETVFDYNCQLFVEGAKQAVDWLSSEKSKNNSLNQVQIDNYDSWPTPDMVSQFRKSGNRLITWKSLWRRVINNEA